MLQMLLPGTAIVYNGDEIGMEDTLIRWDETKDPRALNAGPLRYHLTSRDGCRTPMQWDDTLNSGKLWNLHVKNFKTFAVQTIISKTLQVSQYRPIHGCRLILVIGE